MSNDKEKQSISEAIAEIFKKMDPIIDEKLATLRRVIKQRQKDNKPV